MEWYPHVTVATVVQKDKHFLMVEEISDGRQVLNQPAGHLDADESLQQAAIRETFEETGWHVELLGLLGVTVCKGVNGITYVRFTFAAKALEQDPNATLDTDIVSAVWLTGEEILANAERLRSPMVLKDIQRYQEQTPQPLAILDYIPLK